jgi:hypothetical protein
VAYGTCLLNMQLERARRFKSYTLRIWGGGRAFYGTGLENQKTERSRGLKSHLPRQIIWVISVNESTRALQVRSVSLTLTLSTLCGPYWPVVL